MARRGVIGLWLVTGIACSEFGSSSPAPVCVAACLDGGEAGPNDVAPDDTPFADASSGDDAAPPLAPCALGMPFGAPEEVIVTGAFASKASFWVSADERKGYLGQAITPDTIGIFSTKRETTTQPFEAPIEESAVNTTPLTYGASLTADGREMYVYSGSTQRAVRSGNDGPFGTPSALDPFALNPFVLPNKSALYSVYQAATNDLVIRRALPATTASGWGLPTEVLGINSTSNEDFPVPSEDDLALYFRSYRKPSFGKGDLWVATRASTSDPWSAPVHVAELNTAEEEWPGVVLNHGCTIYFLRGSASLARIYRATKPK